MSEEKARKAQEILDNPVFKEAVEGALMAAQSAWLVATDPQTRESLWHKAKAVDAVVGELRKLRDAGVVARHQRGRGA